MAASILLPGGGFAINMNNRFCSSGVILEHSTAAALTAPASDRSDLRLPTRMRFYDPMFDHREEFLRFSHNLLGFRFSGDIGLVVIDHIPLAPAPVKIIRIRTRRLSHGQSQALEQNPVVSGAV